MKTENAPVQVHMSEQQYYLLLDALRIAQISTPYTSTMEEIKKLRVLVRAAVPVKL
jgi:hypothetical protein